MAVPKIYMNEIEQLQERLTNMEAGFSQPGVTVGGEDIKLTYDADYRRLADFLEIKVEDMNDNSEKLQYLMEWSKSKTDGDLVDAMYEIKKLKDKLGFSEVGATGLKKLNEYIRLSDEQNSLFKRVESIKKQKELLKSTITKPLEEASKMV